MFCLGRKLPLLFRPASNLSVQGWVWGGLGALNLFFLPCTHWHPSPLSSQPSFLCTGNQGVSSGWERDVHRLFKSETMCHNIEGFLLATPISLLSPQAHSSLS